MNYHNGQGRMDVGDEEVKKEGTGSLGRGNEVKNRETKVFPGNK